MAIQTKCQTPGAIFHTHIQPDQISIQIELNRKLALDQDEADLLISNIHNVLEIVLSKYFEERIAIE